MAAAVTGWLTAAVLALGGTAVAAAAATPAAPVGQLVVQAGEAEGVDSDARRPPLSAEPVRRFEPPPHDYGPGHRGVDLPAAPGDVVVSPADGVVTFAGVVAGRGVVVVEHAGTTLTSLEPVAGLVAVGTAVAAGRPVATVQATPGHAGCPTAAGVGCLHWGVRVEGRYVDPWRWLGRGGPVRLLPLDHHEHPVAATAAQNQRRAASLSRRRRR